jgi:hypothetical protein
MQQSMSLLPLWDANEHVKLLDVLVPVTTGFDKDLVTDLRNRDIHIGLCHRLKPKRW